MLRGLDLWRESCPSWEEGGSFLLLNSRMQDGLRRRILEADFPDLPDHVWLATSGTGGRCKLVALGRSALEASARAVNEHLGAMADDVWLNPLPLFHVGGLGILVRAYLAGSRCEVFAEAWEAGRYVEVAVKCGATLSSLVPTQVHDLVRGGWRAPGSMRAVVVGGGVLTEKLRAKAAALGWPLLPSYGMTEAASQVATAVAGQADFVWLPMLRHLEGRVDGGGVLELRGGSLLSGWMTFEEGGRVTFEDARKDGWFRTSDRVELRGGALRVLGRADDLVKIRGELVDVAALERALRERVLSGDLCVRVESDARNGYALSLLAENEAAAREALAVRDEIFPVYARPEEIVVGAIERTALGKVLRR